MFTFHPYGLLISLGILAGVGIAWWRKKLYGISENDLENLFLLVVPLGVIGARIYHVLDKWSYYSQNPFQILAVWNGGLGIYGGIVGGVAGVVIFVILKFKPPNLFSVYCYLLSVLDFLMPSLALGQAIARWGNFFNHEVFGPPTNLPWGWYIPSNLRPEMWKNFEFFQPTFAYESLWALIGFLFLLKIEKTVLFLGAQEKNVKEEHPSSSSVKLEPRLRGSPRISSVSLLKLSKFYYDDYTKGPIANYGLLTGFYCVWYGVGRFFLEFWRFDTAEISGIKTAQIISLFLIVFGLWIVIGRKKE